MFHVIGAGIKGVGTTNLKQSRSFYQAYRSIGPTLSDQSVETEKGQTASDQSALQPSFNKDEIRQTVSAELAQAFRLGWSHYVELLTIDNPDERRFYEIEAQQNGWGVRELKRQIASSLYERLALSRDKNEIRRLAREGQVVEKAADLIKNPLVLEFLDLPERPGYSESELENTRLRDTNPVDFPEQFRNDTNQLYGFWVLRPGEYGSWFGRLRTGLLAFDFQIPERTEV